MLHLKLANLEDAKAEYEALCRLPTDENGFKNDWSEVSFNKFQKTGMANL